MSNKMHSALSEILPFWFVMLSPLIGIILGIVAAWFVLLP
jgi:hypothetical protein